MPIKFFLEKKSYFYPLLLKYSSVMLLFIEIPSCPSLCALFLKKKYCIESLTKRKTFPIIHPPLMETPAKNTIGLSIKRVTFTSGSNKKTVISPPIFTLLHFFFLSHKDHTKTLTMSQQ